MLRAAVTAVRGVSFKPMHPLSGVYAGVIHFGRKGKGKGGKVGSATKGKGHGKGICK